MRSIVVIFSFLAMGPFPLTTRAEPPREPAAPGSVAKSAAAAIENLEFTGMLNVILKKGANMGPGDGWFKPSESRYGWKWLAAKFDANKDGKITSKELGGSADLFRRLDRNRDDKIASDDLDWTDGNAFARQMSQATTWLRLGDANEDRKLSKAEWDAIFAKAVQGKDYANAEDVRSLMFPPQPASRPPSAGDMPTKSILLKGLFSGELGSPCVGPKLNRAAPDFTLKSPEGMTSVTLSKLIGPKPVVLIFGSFT